MLSNVCWFLSLLAGSHSTGTCYNYLKPYSLFIPHFVRVVSCLAWSVCIWCHLTCWGVQPLNANLDQPASGEGCITEYSSNPAVSAICLMSGVYCLRLCGIIVLPFRIIANHCHSSTKYDVLKIVILNEDTPLDAQRKWCNQHVCVI